MKLPLIQLCRAQSLYSLWTSLLTTSLTPLSFTEMIKILMDIFCSVKKNPSGKVFKGMELELDMPVRKFFHACVKQNSKNETIV